MGSAGFPSFFGWFLRFVLEELGAAASGSVITVIPEIMLLCMVYQAFAGIVRDTG